MSGKLRISVGSWSMFAQTALLIIAALLLAQVCAFFLTRNVIDQWRESNVVEPAIAGFAEAAAKIAAVPPDARAAAAAAAKRDGARFTLAPSVHFPQFLRDGAIEQSLGQALSDRSVTVRNIIATHPTRSRPPMSDPGRHGTPPNPGFGDGMPRPDNFDGPMPDKFGGPQPDKFGGPLPDKFGGPLAGRGDEVRLAAELDAGQWLIGEFRVERPFPMLLNPLVLSQIALFIILLSAMLFWASRISRPLRILARAAESLRPQEAFDPIPVKGPAEVRVAIASFNTMAQRVRDLLVEKDRMLSAIGHDLRTPLAGLRIRAEIVEPESEREKFIEAIGEMTAMVEEILAFARLNHSTEPCQTVDLTALADAVVEEFHSLGKDVTFVETERTTLPLQVNLVRRLLRNLVDNAVKYGERATVTVNRKDGAVEVRIEDEGPGIPGERLADVMQPFTRLDSSRNRSTGGTGLGLSIADAIAKSQGAELILENRETGGLRAILRWPPPV